MEPTATHATAVVERSFAKPPEAVFAAFSDPTRKKRWFATSPAAELLSYDFDFRVGGVERVHSRFKPGTPIAGVEIVNTNTYQDIVPNRRIVIAQTQARGGAIFSASVVTLEFLKTDKGTDVICTHQDAFFEGADGPEMRKQGWIFLFTSLAKELES